MSFFYDRDTRGRPFEHTVLSLLASWHIPAGPNPHSGTEDPRRADYDIWLYSPDSGLTLECKKDWKSEDTGNICVEVEALRHSKAFLFVYGLPYTHQTRKVIYLHAFTPYELEKLVRATKLTEQGRFYAFTHRQAGDQPDNEVVLLPRPVVRAVGKPFGEAIKQLTKAA